MARPSKCRRVSANPQAVHFKPAGVMMRDLEQLELTLDEFEAVRLADYEGMYQDEAAEQMNVSRQTFGNIIGSAHRKIADFLVNAKSLTIAGGSIEIAGPEPRYFLCNGCANVWQTEYTNPGPALCPECGSENIHRMKQGVKRCCRK